MKAINFDVAVIGGGAAGLFAASTANALGAKVCLIEKRALGGDCTWFGCVPSKALLKSASVAHLFKEAAKFGLKISGAADTTGVMKHVRETIQEISTHHPPEVFEKRGIAIIYGQPEFVGVKELEVKEVKYSSSGNKEDCRILAKRFIICTGSHPFIPTISGLEKIDYLTNENIFNLETLPASLAVLGGGPIGVELSQALGRLGVEVSIIEMLPRILFREDIEAAGIVESELKAEGIILLTGKKAVKFTRNEQNITLTLENGAGAREEISTERVLVAVGRVPNTEGLALERAGVAYTSKGLEVNAYLQTTNKDIFGAGDVVGPYMFSHMAAYQAQISVRNALLKRMAWGKVNYSNVPWATFTDPELAHLGMTEEEARKAHKKIKIYKSPYAASDRAFTDREEKGLVKIITNKRGYLLGAHLAGAKASEIIQGLLLAKSLKIPLRKLSAPTFIYPTLSELVKKTSAKPLIEKLDNLWVKKILRFLRKV